MRAHPSTSRRSGGAACRRGLRHERVADGVVPRAARRRQGHQADPAELPRIDRDPAVVAEGDGRGGGWRGGRCRRRRGRGHRRRRRRGGTGLRRRTSGRNERRRGSCRDRRPARDEQEGDRDDDHPASEESHRLRHRGSPCWNGVGPARCWTSDPSAVLRSAILDTARAVPPIGPGIEVAPRPQEAGRLRRAERRCECEHAGERGHGALRPRIEAGRPGGCGGVAGCQRGGHAQDLVLVGVGRRAATAAQ